MKIVIASDHAGFPLKQSILDFLHQEKIQAEDLGVYTPARVDYPEFASRVAEQVSSQKADAGILVCGTGLGMMITANKFKNVRATLISDIYSARMAKEHNNANVIGLGGRITDPAKAVRLVKTWLNSSFKAERHQARLDKIAALEEKNFK